MYQIVLSKFFSVNLRNKWAMNFETNGLRSLSSSVFALHRHTLMHSPSSTDLWISEGFVSRLDLTR